MADDHDPWTALLDRHAAPLLLLARQYVSDAAEAALPWSEFDPDPKAYTFGRKANADSAGSSLVHYVGSERVAATRLELFRAALEVARRGPDAVKAFKDPAGDGREPFRYRGNEGGGFTLSSKLLEARPCFLGPGPAEVTVGEAPGGKSTGAPKAK